jgi:hypothetical protein
LIDWQDDKLPQPRHPPMSKRTPEAGFYTGSLAIIPAENVTDCWVTVLMSRDHPSIGRRADGKAVGECYCRPAHSGVGAGLDHIDRDVLEASMS